MNNCGRNLRNYKYLYIKQQILYNDKRTGSEWLALWTTMVALPAGFVVTIVAVPIAATMAGIPAGLVRYPTAMGLVLYPSATMVAIPTRVVLFPARVVLFPLGCLLPLVDRLSLAGAFAFAACLARWPFALAFGAILETPVPQVLPLLVYLGDDERRKITHRLWVVRRVHFSLYKFGKYDVCSCEAGVVLVCQAIQGRSRVAVGINVGQVFRPGAAQSTAAPFLKKNLKRFTARGSHELFEHFLGVRAMAAAPPAVLAMVVAPPAFAMVAALHFFCAVAMVAGLAAAPFRWPRCVLVAF